MAQGNPSWGKGYHDGFDDGEDQGTRQGRVEGLVAAAVVAASVWTGRQVVRRIRGSRVAETAAPDLIAEPESITPQDDRGEELIVLTAEAARLLQHVGQSPAPLAMSDHFVLLNPSPPDFDEDHPAHPAWVERQLALHAASVELAEQDLVCVVTPSNGVRPDLVDLTPAGLAVLLRL